MKYYSLLRSPSPLPFLAVRAGHERGDGIDGGLVLVEDRIHLARDRHVDAEGLGQVVGGLGGGNALGDFVHSGQDLWQRLAAAQADAEGVVAAQGAAAGSDQVAKAGDAVE